jgi:hypothetical protein
LPNRISSRRGDCKEKKITPHMIMDGRVPGRYTEDLKFLREFWGLGNISRPGAIIYLLV